MCNPSIGVATFSGEVELFRHVTLLVEMNPSSTQPVDRVGSALNYRPDG
jgi:hypothetical protein